MSGGGAPAAPSPLLAFAELRARLAWRRLRGRGGVPELVARIVLFAVAIPAGLAFAVLAGAGAWHAVRTARGRAIDVAVGAVFFGVWQTWTAIALSVSDRDTVDLRRYLAYPIPPARIFAYGLAASVVGDPFAALWMLFLAGAFAGAALARPGAWLALLALAYALFVAATVALVAALQEVLAGMLRARRARAVAIAAAYVGAAAAALFATGGARSALHAGRVFRTVRWIALPPALAERAVSALYAGRVAAAVPWLLALASAAAALAWAGYRLALVTARSAEGAPRAAARGIAGWRLPGRLGPLLEKEGKAVVRHPLAAVLILVVPALSAFAGWKISPRIPAEAGEVVRALPLLAFALYAHLAAQPFWLNAFGWERGGARAWFLAPVAAEDVLRAKNAAAYALSLAVFGVSAAAGAATGGAPPAWALAGAVLLHAGVAPFFLAAGNVVSILSPRAASLSVQRGGHLPAVSALAGMAVVTACASLFAVPALLAIRADEPWLLPAGFAALGIGGAALYRAALPRAARLLRARREPLLDAVCGEE